MFSIRLVSVEHYMGNPVPGLDAEYSDFRGVDVKQVPVIRVFGSDITGTKTCLHVHGVFPYICIPCEGSGGDDRLRYQIASSLDKAINISLGKANSTVQHVFKVVLVSGLPFYGYHCKEHLFFKIYFYNPLMVKKATELLQNGAILNKIYQPHEAHVPYILQFMIDYNLYGMNLINLQKVKLRRDPENTELLENFPEDMFLPLKIVKMSTCELEVDAVAGDIINRKAMRADLAVNPGLAAIWEDEKKRRREEGRCSQITPQNSQQRPNVSPTSSEILHKQRLHEKLLDLSAQSSENSSEEITTPYPAETPEGSDLLEASFVDIHVPSAKSASLVEKHDAADDDTSVVDEDLILSLTSSQRKTTPSFEDSSTVGSFDEELAALLSKLEESADVDEDSILGSQMHEDLDHCSNEEDVQDLSQSLDFNEERCEDRCSDEQNSDDGSVWENSYWNIAEDDIPQLDGVDDDPINQHDAKFRRRRKSLSLHKNKEQSDYSEARINFPKIENCNNVENIISNDTHGHKSKCENTTVRELKQCLIAVKEDQGCAVIGGKKLARKIRKLKRRKLSLSCRKNTKTEFERSIDANIPADSTKIKFLDDSGINLSMEMKYQDTRTLLCSRERTATVSSNGSDESTEVETKHVNSLIDGSYNVENKQAEDKTSVNIIGVRSSHKIGNVPLPAHDPYLMKSDDCEKRGKPVICELSESSSKLSLIGRTNINSFKNSDSVRRVNNASREKKNSHQTRPSNLLGKYQGFDVNSLVTCIQPCFVRLERLSSQSLGLEKKSFELHRQQNCIFKNSPVGVSPKIHRRSRNKCKTIVSKKTEEENDKKRKWRLHPIHSSNVLCKYRKGKGIVESIQNCGNVASEQSRTKKIKQMKSTDRCSKMEQTVAQCNLVSSMENEAEIVSVTDERHQEKLRSSECKFCQLNDSKINCGSPCKTVIQSHQVLQKQNEKNIFAGFVIQSGENCKVANFKQERDYIEGSYNRRVGCNFSTFTGHRSEETSRCDTEESNSMNSHSLVSSGEKENSDKIQDNNNSNKCNKTENNMNSVVENLGSKIRKETSVIHAINYKGREAYDEKTRENNNGSLIDVESNKKCADSASKHKINKHKCVININYKYHRTKEMHRKYKKHIKRKAIKNELSPNSEYKLKPLTINLVRLDQSVLSKYDTVQTEQENRNSTNKEDKKGKIRTVDGEFETSSSDDTLDSDTKCLEGVGSKNLQKSKGLNRQEQSEQDSYKHCTHLPKVTSLKKQPFIIPSEELKKDDLRTSQSPTKSPKRNIYPPLTVKIQKSPKKNIISETHCRIPNSTIQRDANSFEDVNCKMKKITRKRNALGISIRKGKKSSIVANEPHQPGCSHARCPGSTADVMRSSTSADKQLQINIKSISVLEKSSGIKNNYAEQSVSCVKSASEKLQTSRNKTMSPKENYSSDISENNAESTLKEKYEETVRKELNFALEVKEDVNNLVSDPRHQNSVNKGTSSAESNTDSRSVDSKRRGSSDVTGRETSSLKDKEVESSLTLDKVEERRLMSKDRFVCNEDEGVLSFYDDTVAGLDVIELSTNNSAQQNSGTKFTDRSFGETEFHHQIFTPRYKPPSKLEILTGLTEFNISEHKHQKPFMSNALDVMGKKFVGNQVLKVSSNSVVDLQPFTSGLHDIRTIEMLRLHSLQDFLSASQRSLELNIEPASKCTKSALASHKAVIITPCKPSPKPVEVKMWLKQKALSNVEKNATNERSKQIYVPMSPGQNSDSDDAMSLSLTSASTPQIKSIVESPSESPELHNTPEDENNVFSPDSTPLNTKGMRRWKRSRRRLKLRCNSQEVTFPNKEEELRASSLETKAVQHKCSEDIDLKVEELMKTPDCVRKSDNSCQTEGKTSTNTYKFRMSLGNLQDVKAVCEHQYLTTLIMELHFHTRGDLKPDPEYDPIRAIFYVVVNDVPEDFASASLEKGIIVEGNVKIPSLGASPDSCNITYVDDEKALLMEFVKNVRKWDPDILAGYEVEMLSWGYVFQRAFKLEMNLYPLISRIPSENDGSEHRSDKASFTSEIKLSGRIILNIWRLMRHEIALQSYTYENVAYHVLHQRIPLHTYKQLTTWWEHQTHLYRWLCVDYYMLRVMGIVKILEQLDLIGRTCELARLFGIQFYEVLSRGSQFRVESMMLRLAKPRNYVSVSPSIQQRANMRAPETLPLIMEPSSRYYADPMIVLDFQSLYPSIIIAYNYCFSTCLGRVEYLGQYTPFPFGCTQLRVSPSQALHLMNNITISPCGVVFVKQGKRKGVLPLMLEEILDTRLMVKQSMKEHKSNKTLQRVLHSRQLGLKLIANVTYGYTAANFSGRMPCTEVGDSVVSKARETLERAIHLVEATPRWRAQVVYGDTDSLFVLVPGRNIEQAFKIGAEIAEAVTLDNPKPVKLKLEKVYQPCILQNSLPMLQTKKRYVGYKYERPEQSKPVYEAKGIETVRRDGCPAVAKILEKSLRLLFESQDMSVVKSYVCRQFTKILQGQINLQDLIFAREYRGMSGYRPGACVPALELARCWLQTDKRAEPRQSERVPYIIVNGPPGIPLIRLVRSPHEVLSDSSLRPNITYYITRVIIPPLDRCFSLVGADVGSWYNDMPRKLTVNLATYTAPGLSKNTISQHFATLSCAVCGCLTNSGICLPCQQRPQNTAVVLASKIQSWERKFTNITRVCQSCCGHDGYIDCASLDCPVLFSRNQVSCELHQASCIRRLQDQYLSF